MPDSLELLVGRIEGKLDGLAAGGGSKQVVGSSPIGGTGTGVVRLINEYPTDVEIVVKPRARSTGQARVTVA